MALAAAKAGACRTPWALRAALAGALALLLLGAPAVAPVSLGQGRPSLSLPELRSIGALRQAREARQHEQAVTAANDYLGKFPQGRYADEALLALGESLRDLGRAKEALAAYERLISEFPDSPFREQAQVDSLPLLQSQGSGAQATDRLATLRKNNPDSLVLGKALLWRAREQYGQKQFEAAAGLLAGENPAAGLSEAEQTEWLRLQGWSLLQDGRPAEAWPVFARYLARDDAIEQKVPVLMRLAEASQASGALRQALDYYQEVIGRYPHPDFVNEALYRRAEVFTQVSLPPEGETGAAATSQALAYYDAYLATGDATFQGPALKGRAALLARIGRPADALADYERLAALNTGQPPDPGLLQGRAELLAKVGRGQEATALLAGALASTTLPREARAPLVVALAALHYEQKQCGAVLRVLQPLPVFREAEHRQKAFFLRGFCHFRNGDWEKASFDLEGLVNDPAYQREVWPPLMEAYERSGQWARLVNLGETLVAAERVGPSEALLAQMGRGYQKLGQPEMLLSVLERLAAVNPVALKGAPIQFQLGLAKEAMGRPAEAEAHFLAVLKAPPPKPAPAEGKGDQGAPPEPDPRLGALERLQPLLAEKGDFGRLAALNAAARKEFKAPEAQARVRAWQAAANLAWGQVEAKAGNTRPAREKFQLAEKTLLAVLKEAPNAEIKAALAARISALYQAWAEAGSERAEVGDADDLYRRALEVLPEGAWRERHQIALHLDGRYAAAGNFAGRAALWEKLLPHLKEKRVAEEVRSALVRIYLAWGKQETEAKHNAQALKAFQKGRTHLLPGAGELQYAFSAGLAEVYLATGDYSRLTIEYERILPGLKAPQRKAEVTVFLGQVYLAWAREGVKAENAKSVRVRALRALQYLPEHAWRERLAATGLLMDVLDEQKEKDKAAEWLEKVMPALPEGEARQEQAIRLAVRYLDLPGKRSNGWNWLKEADGGGNDPFSLEAGFRMANLELEAKHRAAGTRRLESLVARGLEGSLWRVPIHYRLAVVYHEGEAIKKALQHYQAVAGVKSAALRKTYPTLIQQAAAQAKAIKDYLSLQGGGGGSRISIPKVNP